MIHSINKTVKLRNNYNSSRRLMSCLFAAVLTGVALTAFSPDAAAQGDKFSYRLRGLGQGLYGIVDDLYSDLSFNPAYIHRYKGTSLFTNISNMQGKTDQRQLNQEETDYTLVRSTDIFPSNLIGTVTDRFGSPMGFFFESQGYNLSLTDDNSNTVFNTLTAGKTTGESLKLGTDFSGRSFTWLGLVRGYGVSLSYHRLGFDLNLDSSDYSESFIATETEGTRISTGSKVEREKTNLSMPNSMIAFSVGKVIRSGTSELSISAGRRPERIVFDANDIFSLFEEPFFGGGEDIMADLQSNDLGFMEIGLKTYFVNMRMKNIQSSLTSLQQNSLLFKYERFNLPLAVEAVQETIDDSLHVSGANRKTMKTTRYGITSGDGDGNLNNLEFGAGFERHFNNMNTMIAMGAKFNYLSGDLDFTFSPGKLQETYEVSVEIGDPAEEADSFTRTISDERNQLTTGSLKGLILTVPVGLETKLTKRLTVRLGARSVIPLSFKTEWETTIDDGVDELLETDEETSSFVPPDPFPAADFQKTMIDGKSLNLDSYHFGAHYEINEMIGIDFLHFAKVTELDTWWLSVVLKY